MFTVVLSYNEPTKPHSREHLKLGEYLGFKLTDEQIAAGNQRHRVVLDDSLPASAKDADLVCIYTGHTLEHLRTDLRDLKQQGIGTEKVVIITCTCERAAKACILTEEGFGEAEAYGAECGGAETMGELVENFQYRCVRPKDFFEFRRKRAVWAANPFGADPNNC